LGERTLFQQEASGRGGGPIVSLSDDVAAIVDTARGRLQETGEIDLCEGSVAEQEPVRSVRGVISREANDVAPGVDALRGCISRSRHVNNREGERECNQRNTEDKKRDEGGSFTHGDLSLSKRPYCGRLAARKLVSG